MLNNFVISLEAVLPMFILIIIGAIVRKSGILTSIEIKHLNKMVFSVFFPAMMFCNIYGSDISGAFNWDIVIYGVSAVLILYFAAVAFALKVEKSQKSRGAMIQAIYRSNFVIMGIPIAMNMYGNGHVAVTALMVAIIVPIYNVLAVITLEIFRGKRPNLLNIIKQVAKNPLIIGAVMGIVAVLFNITLPKMIDTVIMDMSNVATPMALVILGGSISFKSIERCGKKLIFCVVGRLIVAPAFGLIGAALLGFRGIEFVTLIAIFAAPTAVSSFTMAESMDSDGELAGNCVVFSSAFACFTMFFWIFLFKNLGMF